MIGCHEFGAAKEVPERKKPVLAPRGPAPVTATSAYRIHDGRFQSFISARVSVPPAAQIKAVGRSRVGKQANPLQPSCRAT